MNLVELIRSTLRYSTYNSNKGKISLIEWVSKWLLYIDPSMF